MEEKTLLLKIFIFFHYLAEVLTTLSPSARSVDSWGWLERFCHSFRRTLSVTLAASQVHFVVRGWVKLLNYFMCSEKHIYKYKQCWLHIDQRVFNVSRYVRFLFGLEFQTALKKKLFNFHATTMLKKIKFHDPLVDLPGRLPPSIKWSCRGTTLWKQLFGLLFPWSF